jgi:CDP-paratose 2-epimerase
MKILITGVCGFVGSTLAIGLAGQSDFSIEPLEIIGLDNLSRTGSATNQPTLSKMGVQFFHGDVRCPEDLRQLPPVDWVIDASANPSVLAGTDGKSSARQVFDHNLVSTINLLEYCKQHRAGFLLLSTSRVYSISPLSALPMKSDGRTFSLDQSQALPTGVSLKGVAENFSTETPVSLYGASKLASEMIALEYGQTFDFPVWINRCGVLAGAGQFGRADQGIFAFWINAWLRRRPLKFIGFGGHGWQARDAMHPLDLLPLLKKQFAFSGGASRRIYNLGGGPQNTLSLLQLSDWCRDRFGEHLVASDSVDRKFDIPWMVMDHSRATADWDWKPQISIGKILAEIAVHAEANPDWLAISGA